VYPAVSLWLGRYLGRENEPHHVQSLLRCRPAAPDCVNSRCLVGDVRPTVARHFLQFSEPIGEGLFLPPRDMLGKGSCHVSFLVALEAAGVEFIAEKAEGQGCGAKGERQAEMTWPNASESTR
jgi:hypothetical protein